MARTSQTAGHAPSKAAYTQDFDDHKGNSALRIGTCTVVPGASPEPPSDFSLKPVFCFQVYTSIELDLDDERPATKRSQSATSGSGNASITPVNIARLKSFLAPQIHEAECPDPIWEVYTLPGADAFAFVDHARKEIARRKSQHKRHDFSAPLIPQLVLSDDDERKAAFLIAIDAASGWETSSQGAGGKPLWMHFDPRIPASVKTTEHALRLEDAPGTMGLSEDEIRVWPEQVDELIKRVADHDETVFKLPTMLSLSCASEEYREEDVNLEMEFGLDGEGSTAEEPDLSSGLQALRDAVSELKSTKLTVTRDGNTISVTNASTAKDPDLRYAVYVPFLADSDDAFEMLEHTAKVFTDAVCSKLASLPAGREKTVHFDFSIPPEASDASITTVYRAAQHASDYSGALMAQEAGADQASRRLYPLHINPHVTLNDPATCGFERYKTFVVVIDNANFLGRACVRFLLADGGKNLENESLSYLEGQAWRSADMEKVARRLAMMGLEDGA